jgi:UDP-N-acetylmuramate--alanine ligase
MFEEGGKDPLAIVGARVSVPGFEENYRSGEGPFIVEGCEYRRGMLHIHPSCTIITNIEADHLDYYKGIEDIQDAFSSYVGALPTTGYCVWNKEDSGSAHIPSKTKARTCSFGIHEGDLHVEHLVTSEEGMTADVIFRGEKLGAIRSPLSGAFNMQNILAAMAMALCHNVPFEAISRAISSFQGIGRRFELLGEVEGVPVYSDYAHHPTALYALAHATEEKFGKGNTLIIFQPHQIDRTKKLSKEFIDVFRNISHLCVTEIYFVAGREHAGSFSVAELVEKANIGRTEPIRFFKSLDEVSSVVAQEIHRYTAVCFAGAGDIDRFARHVVVKHPL